MAPTQKTQSGSRCSYLGNLRMCFGCGWADLCAVHEVFVHHPASPLREHGVHVTQLQLIALEAANMGCWFTRGGGIHTRWRRQTGARWDGGGQLQNIRTLAQGGQFIDPRACKVTGKVCRDRLKSSRKRLGPRVSILRVSKLAWMHECVDLHGIGNLSSEAPTVRIYGTYTNRRA